MNGEINIHGLWGLRDETLEDTVHRVAESFRKLGEISPDWSRWRRGYRSFEDRARGAVMLNENPELIREELLRGQVRDDDGNVKRHLGYMMSAFAGPEKASRMESSEFHVDSCKRKVTAGVNIMYLVLPTQGPSVEAVTKLELLAAATAKLADIWSPDWLSVREILSEIQLASRHDAPAAGWVTYVAPRVATVSDLPRGWRWWEGRDERQIFICENGIPSKEKPEHIVAVGDLAKHIHWKT